MTRLRILSLLLFFPASIQAEMIQKWDFGAKHWKGSTIADQLAKLPGESTGVPSFDKSHLVLKENRFINVPDISAKNLPTKALTVSARVAIDKGQKWGSIVGYLQDNGSYERGWSLGYNESKYAFWVSTGGSLIQVQSKRPFRPGQWDSLTGVFDGNEIRLYVNGVLSGQAVAKGAIAYPERAKYTIGAYQDDNELYPMLGKLDAITLHDTPLDEAAIRKAAGLAVPLEFSIRPSVRFLSPKTAMIDWAVDESQNGRLEIGKSENLGKTLPGKPTAAGMETLIPDLEPQTVYYFRITHGEGDTRQSSPIYEFNTSLNYSPPLESGVGPSKRGYAVIIGAEQEVIDRFVAETEMSIVVFETDSDQVNGVRKNLYERGVYGSRVTIQKVKGYTNLPITSCMADVVDCPSWSNAVSMSEIKRILAPGHGLASIRKKPTASNPAQEIKYQRPAPDNSGEWTHQYGDSGNTVTSGESLSGAAATGDLSVQWFGRPGADFGLDRGNRLPAPLAVNNRLFHQGMNRLIALNSMNGTYLWSLEIPEFQRLNMPRDASNWCADNDTLYVAFLERAWVLDAQTGKRRSALTPLTSSGKRNWGYIARDKNRLIGSATKPNSEYTEYWSKKMWFDGKANSYGTAQVCSDSLFGYDSDSLKPVWQYESGVILNPTISISNHTVYFVESRNEVPKSSITSQISAPELWHDQYLVAIDLEKGTKLWERPIDTEDGTITFYMQATPEMILLAASNTKYHLYTFATKDGTPGWKHSNAWPDNHHSGHLQHPVILDDTIYLQPNGYDLKTGKIVTKKLGARSGCPTYIGADKALIYRGSGRRVAMWNRETETVSTWDRLRPSCWLSMIPANGMLLVPEGGGGCSCGNWMETSIGFAPRVLLQAVVE